MRLLYVHERFGALGGAESNVYITASEFKKRNHEVGIVHGPGTSRNEEEWRATFNNRYLLRAGEERSLVKNAIDQFRPDVIYVHKIADLPVLETLVESGIPLVRMMHDHDVYCMKSYRYAYFSRKICNRAFSPYCIFPCAAFVARDRESKLPLKFVSYSNKKREIELNRRFHRVLVVTEYMRQELLLNGFNESKIEIHPPIPRMASIGARSSFSDRNLILYVGQLIRGKGVDILLQSLAQVRCNFECIILGDGSHRAYCERLSRKLGLQDRVRFKGFVNQDELKKYFSDCSVVAISSVWPEPIATVGLEVMRYGLPVVAFDAGGIKDWLIDGCNGFLVPWMDRKQYAARIEQLLRDKSLAKRMGEEGLKFSNEKYDFQQYLLNLEQLFQAVCQERNISPSRNTNTKGKEAICFR